jgi:transposase
VPEAIDPRDVRIAELEAKVAFLMAKLEAQEAELVKLRAENAGLRARLAQNSTNSSKPPSTDPPSILRPPKEPTGRRPGGQPGHKGHKRELLRPDDVVPLFPERCSGCEAKLTGQDEAPLRHQVVEVPPIRPHVTEYQLHARSCPRCGKRTRATLPAGVPRGAFGPRLSAMAAICTGKYRMPKRAVEELFQDFLGVDLALGSVCKIEQTVSEAIAAPVEAARAFVREQPMVNGDETGWREGRARAWLWTMVTPQVTVFQIARSRGSNVAKEMLGEDYCGYFGSDRWSGYNWLRTGRRQLCWSHLDRDFQGFVDRGGLSAGFGEILLAESTRMFKWWGQVCDGLKDRTWFQRKMRKVRRLVGGALLGGTTCGDPKTEGMCREIRKLEPALWTFVDVEGIEPTNNTAERAIRPAVIWRKGSFGTQGENGSRFVERILSTVATLKQQGRHVLDYLTAACEAALHVQPAPSLLPSDAGS